MTITYDLGLPKAANLRGGDVRARDTTQARKVFGPHRFAGSGDLKVSNGLLRLTVDVAGAFPSVIVSAYTAGALTSAATTYTTTTVYDATTLYFDDIYAHLWTAMGSVIFDSPAVSASLASAHLVSLTPERATICLISTAIANVYVTLRRGERMLRIQHGSTRPPFLTLDRRVRWGPPPAGVAVFARVSEDVPAVANSPRFIATESSDATVSGPAFSITVPAARSASFGAGVGTVGERNTPADMHGQLFDSSRATLTVGA